MSDQSDQRTFRSMAAVFVVLALCKLAALIRDMLIANAFGASSDTDAYMAAHQATVQLATSIGTALSLALIPVYLAAREDQRDGLLSSLINRYGLALFVLSALGALFPGTAINILAPGFDEATAAVAGRFFRLISATFGLVALAGMISGAMNARRSFLIPASGPGVLNLAIVAAVLALSGRLGIYAVAIGILLGGCCQMILYWVHLGRLGHAHSFSRFKRHEESGRMLRLFLPIFAGTALGQVSLMINNAMASTLDPGNITVLGFAYRMLTLVIGLFLPISTVLFPELSRAAASNDEAEALGHVEQGLGLIIFFALPCTVGIMVLGGPLVDVLFRHGEFASSDAAQLTAWALLAYAPGLIGIVAGEFLSRAFYSLEKPNSPLVVGVATLALNVILNIVLIHALPGRFRYLGLAGATTFSILLNIAVMVALLKRRLSGIRIGAMMGRLTACLVLSLGMGLACWAVMHVLHDRVNQVISLVSALIVGAACYSLLALAARVPEAGLLLAQIRALISRKA